MEEKPGLARPAAIGASRVTKMTPRVNKLALAWGLCIALALAVECVLHCVPAQSLLRYDQVSTKLDPAADYVNIRRAVSATEAPAICIIGSSRAKAIMSAPTIREVLKDKGFGEVGVRVYAAPNLNAAACLSLTRLMKTWRHHPKVIIYAVEPRQLADLMNSSGTFAVWFSNPTRLYRDTRLCAVKESVLAWTDTHMRTLWLREAARLQPAVTSQVFGGYASNHLRHMPQVTGAIERTMSVHPVAYGDLIHSLWYVDCERRLTPSPAQQDYSEEAIRTMREFCEPILVELPFPEVTMSAFPWRYYAAAIRFYSEACRKCSVRFVRNSDLGFSPDERFYGDATHANWSGAQEYSRLLAEKIIAPAMEKERQSPGVGYSLQPR